VPLTSEIELDIGKGDKAILINLYDLQKYDPNIIEDD
jgi:hypothetical protein